MRQLFLIGLLTSVPLRCPPWPPISATNTLERTLEIYRSIVEVDTSKPRATRSAWRATSLTNSWMRAFPTMMCRSCPRATSLH
jgi:hypothetical protein